jgi:hypothetical protein
VRTAFILLSLGLLGCGSEVVAGGGNGESHVTSGDIASQAVEGTFEQWRSNRELMFVLDGEVRLAMDEAPSGDLVVSWGRNEHGDCYVYRENFDTKVLEVVGAGEVSDIGDASTLDFEDIYIAGPTSEGHMLLAHHVDSGAYLALRFDQVVEPGKVDSSLGAYADVSWYLTYDGDFSVFGD